MPISLQHEFKFIHIPKTGGSSIEKAFNLFHRHNLFVPRHTEVIEGVKFSPQHLTHNLIEHECPFTKDWFSFTVVRNPYTKLLSEYFYINGIFEGEKVEKFDEDEFNFWIDNSLLKFDMDHKLPQYSFIDKEVDMILRFENFEEDFNILQQKLNTHYKITHTNHDKRGFNKKEIIESLNPSTKEKIYSIFRGDFEKFDYKK